MEKKVITKQEQSKERNVNIKVLLPIVYINVVKHKYRLFSPLSFSNNTDYLSLEETQGVSAYMLTLISAYSCTTSLLQGISDQTY